MQSHLHSTVKTASRDKNIPPIIGVFKLSNTLSNFSKNWGMQGDKAKFHNFHELTLTRFSNSSGPQVQK